VTQLLVRGGRMTSVLVVAVVGMLALDGGWLVAHHHTTAAPVVWRPLRGPGFSVEFPGRPTHQTRPLAIRGSTVVAHLYTLDVDGSRSYGLLYADYPTTVDVSDAHSVLARAAEGSANSVQGNLSPTTFRTVLGQPAVDYVIRVKNLEIRGRSILQDHRLYSLLVGTPNAAGADFGRFTASLRLTPVSSAP